MSAGCLVHQPLTAVFAPATLAGCHWRERLGVAATARASCVGVVVMVLAVAGGRYTRGLSALGLKVCMALNEGCGLVG